MLCFSNFERKSIVEHVCVLKDEFSFIAKIKLSSDWDWDLGPGTWDLGPENRMENGESRDRENSLLFFI